MIGVVVYQITKLFLIVFGLFANSKHLSQTISGVVSALVTGLLVFQSIGGLGAAEVVLLLVFCSLSVFYIVKLV